VEITLSALVVAVLDAEPRVGQLRKAADEVAAGPPVHARVRSVLLMTGSREPGSWTTVADLPLGEG
jgi:hypothetical protein